jgi:NUDIX domain
MNSGRIRALALALIWRGDELLLMEGDDPAKRQTFYRPLGGGVEFGERARDAVIREFAEELEPNSSTYALSARWRTSSPSTARQATRSSCSLRLSSPTTRCTPATIWSLSNPTRACPSPGSASRT